LPKPLDNLKRQLFWIIANSCRKLYGALPLFGTLRAALGVIHRNGKFLVICRNDGRGVSLPGGICSWRESEERTIDREVQEETGLAVSGKKLILRFYNNVDFPCNVSLFEVQLAADSLASSWEGSPQWMTIDEIEPQLVASQEPVLAVFSRIADGEKTLSAGISPRQSSPVTD
jgi:ADP-ribose pyrophosphatase YjhB (NUDIX family)